MHKLMLYSKNSYLFNILFYSESIAFVIKKNSQFLNEWIQLFIEEKVIKKFLPFAVRKSPWKVFPLYNPPPSEHVRHLQYTLKNP